jgi:hypothetical protein
MTDPRDELDTWMNAQVQPLPPPPGTFELIRRRARRRKVAKAVAGAATAAAAIAVIAIVPRLVLTQLQLGPSQQSGAETGQASAAGPGRAQSSHAPGTPPASTATPAGSAPPAAPPNFAAASVTFVGASTGYVIGQAGTPGQCKGPNPDICTSLAGTSDGGRTWHGVPAPVTGVPQGGSGVSQLRFYDTSDGWAFGPGLWATHDGGQTWAQISTGGLRVLALETAGQRVFAVWARCTGTGRGWAAGCTSARLYSAAPGSDQWAAVTGVPASSGTAGTASASLVLTGTRGYFLAPTGILYSGPVDSAGAWQPASSPPGSTASGTPATNSTSGGATSGATPGAAPCAPGSAQAGGQPSGALLAATTPGGLVLVCPGQASGGSQAKAVYTSADGGRAWRQAGTAPAGGTATSVAGTTTGTIVLATTDGIQISQDGGATWTAAQGALPPGGLSYVGMTTPDQGVAVPADTGQFAVWFTRDGGLSWQKSAIP